MVQNYAMFMEEKIEMHHDVRFPYERNADDATRHVADVLIQKSMSLKYESRVQGSRTHAREAPTTPPATSPM